MVVNKLIFFFKFVDVSLFVFFLIILFGFGLWFIINGVWVELLIIVFFVLEQWKFFFYLFLIGQLFNIGLVFVLVFNKVRLRWFKEIVVIYVIIIVGVIFCVMLVFLWQMILLVGGDEYSVVLFIFVFLMSFCDCIFMVIFLLFMFLLKLNYMIGLYIGEGLSVFVFGMFVLG